MKKKLLLYACCTILCLGLLGQMIVNAGQVSKKKAEKMSTAVGNTTEQEQQKLAPGQLTLFTPEQVAAKNAEQSANQKNQLPSATNRAVGSVSAPSVTPANTGVSSSIDPAVQFQKDMEYVKLQKRYGTLQMNDPAYLRVLQEMRSSAPADHRSGSLDQGNDTCPATVIASLPYSDGGSTVGLASDVSGCVGQSPDAIYEFTATNNHDLRATLCGSDYDTQLIIQTGGACPGTTVVECNDDCGEGGVVCCTVQSTIDWCAQSGTTYYIIVSGYFGSSGNYQLAVSDLGTECTPPVFGRCCYNSGLFCVDGITAIDCQNFYNSADWVANETCTSLPCVPPPCNPDFTVTAPVTISGNTCGAGDDCALVQAEDHIYQVTIPTTGQWRFQLCDETVAFWDSYLLIGTNCCSNNLASQDDGCGGINYYLSRTGCIQLTAGVYYVTIEGLYSGQCGGYTLQISQCETGRCCYNSGNSCTNTDEIACTNNFGGTWTSGMTCEANPCPACSVSCQGGDVAEVAETFPVPNGFSLNDPDGGCNNTNPTFQTISCGQSVCGRTFLYIDDISGQLYRDTDWYEFTLTVRSRVTWTVDGESAVLAGILNSPCPQFSFLFSGQTFGGCTGQNAVAQSGCLNPGTYYLWVGHNGPYTGPSTSVSDYRATLTCVECPPCTYPPNDACENAVPQNLPHTFTGTIACANEECAALSGGVYHDAWIAFTIPTCEDVTISYCGSDPTYAQNVYIVLDNSCPCDGSFIFYTSFSFCGDGQYIVQFISLPAGTYYYPILTVEDQIFGPYNIEITGIPCPPPPPNDDCENAVPHPLPATVTGTTVGATVQCGALGWPGEAWEAFTLTTPSTVTIDFCTTSPVMNTVGIVLDGSCPCSGTFLFGSYGNTACGDGNYTISWCNVPAGTWYYPVYKDGSGQSYTMHISAVPVAPIPNDNCAGAVRICSTPYTVNGTTCGAVDDYQTCFNTAPDVIYTITTTAASTDLHADLCGSLFDTRLEIRSGGVCPGDNQLGCNDDSQCGGFFTLQSTVDLFAQPAGTYYIIVDGYSSNSGSYTLNVTTSSVISCCTPDTVDNLAIIRVGLTDDVVLRWFADPSFNGVYDVYASTTDGGVGAFPGTYTLLSPPAGITPVPGIPGPGSGNTTYTHVGALASQARQWYRVVGRCP